MADTWTADQLLTFAATSARLTAELRASVAAPADALVAVFEACHAAELAWIRDPERDDLQTAAKDARTKLDSARAEFDKAVTTAKATRTRKLSDEIAVVAKAK